MSNPTEELVVRASLKDELTRPLREARDELQKTSREAKAAGTNANIGARGFDKMAAGAGRFVKAGVGIAAKAAAAGVVALTAAVVAGSVKVLQWASDGAEAASAFGTVFKGVAGDVPKYLDRLNRRFGIATIELHRAATNFGVFGKAAGVSKKELGGFTKDLVGAGLDLASFYNQDPSEVFTALRSGLAGEAEPLRQFGIFLSDAAMKAEAATMGLKGELNESQKVMIRQRLIMKSLGDAEGDMARTQDGLANKTKAIKGRLRELGTEIGNRLLPYAERAANVLDRRLGSAMDKLPSLLTRAEDSVVGVWAAFQQGGPDAAVAKVDILTGSGDKLIAIWIEAKDLVADLSAILTDSLVPAFGDAAAVTGGLAGGGLVLLRNALGWAADNTDLVRTALTTYIVVVTAAKVASLAKAGAVRIMTAADKVSLFWLKAHTVGTKTHLVVSGAARVATLAWAAATRVLSLAMRANPIGLVITAIGLLIAGVVLAYNKSDRFRGMVDSLWQAIKTAGGWLQDMGEKLDKWVIGKIDAAVGAVKDLVGWIGKIKMPSLDDVGAALNPFGDTATSKARGGGNLGSTLATHASVAAATGTRPTITNALIGGGGRGRGSGDHQAGRALDLQGKGLAKYGAYMRAIGGYAAFHGTGSGRHLHAVPPAMGDNRSSMAGRARHRPTGQGGGRGAVVIEAGAVKVDVHNPGANVDVAAAVRQGIEDYLRDQDERS